VNPLVEAALEFVWPTRCVGCDEHGSLLCPSCREALPFIDPALACPRCGAPFGQRVCTECSTAEGLRPLPFDGAVSACEFTGTAARLVVAYKDQFERRLAPVIAGLIFEVIPRDWVRTSDSITWIPSDAEALRRRGFDHMEAVAEELAAIIGRPASMLLSKANATDQRVLDKQERADNMRGAFELIAEPPQRILLIDDVLTSGATLEGASQMLLTAARTVHVATFARVW
jgi:predicted amidophosphoribosyltransferase